jgi:hypothetical protein
MAIESILLQIDAEIAKLTQARALLANTGKVTAKVAGQKIKKSSSRVKKTRVLSPEARKRIADAQRKRWAAHKAKSK